MPGRAAENRTGVSVQTTLLGIAIALILALVTALIGPYFVNWNDHRAFFEAEASRLAGLNVRVSGPIAVRVLPVPSVSLGDIAIGPLGEASRMRARSLGIELNLGSLMKGEIRAAEMRLVGPEFSLGIDALGQIDWPPITPATETLSIDKLAVEDGRITLADAASGSHLMLDRLWFNGDVRSLSGPVRGEGAFVNSGNLYGYRVSAGRLTDEGTRVRLVVETSERPMNIEADGMLAFDRFGPRFDGSLAVSRPAGVVLATGKTVASEPWRVASKVKATSAAALLENVEFQYGPEERAVKLGGAAEFKFGQRPRLQGAMSARQVDLDRIVATPNAPRRLPLATFQAFAEMFSASGRPPLPVNLTFGVDAVTLGGATLQAVGAELRSDGDGWRFEKLEFRAPGFTQIALSGRLDAARNAGGDNPNLGFTGAASIDANDPKTLIAWLVGRPGSPAQIKPWSARGNITLAADRIAVDQLKTEFERGTLEGRLAYTWPSGERPARLDADLSAGELDVDALLAFADGALSGAGLERPGEVALALEIGRARIAGFEARKTTAKVKFDASGIAVERLSVADFGNASVEASGRIETGSAPGGNITVDLDAREMAGVIALAEKFAPPLAGLLKDLAAREKTAKLRATVALQPASGSATAKLSLAGRIGGVGVNLAASATGKPDAFSVADLRALTATEARIDGRLESENGGVLLALLGFDRFAVAERRPARLTFAAAGPLSGALRFDGKLSAGAIDAEGKGTMRFPPDQAATLDLDQVAGSIGGSKVQGKLALRFDDPVRVDGALETESLDAAALVMGAIGMRRARGNDIGWSPEPFAPSSSELAGRIEIKAQRAAFSPGLVARQFRGVARFGAAQVVFEDVEGEMAGGRIAGRLAFSSSPDGLAARGRIALSGVDAAAMLGTPGRPSVTGRLTLQAEVEGIGLSPVAFIGSLAGSGSISLENARIAGLNPRVFDAVIRAVELGIPTDTNRIRDFVSSSLDQGSLAVAKAEGGLAIAAGQARLVNAVTRASGADLGILGSFNAADATLDATLTLTGMPAAATSIRPAVYVSLKGPMPAPKRSVDASVLASWLALRAVEQQSKRLDAMEQARREAEQASREASVPPAAEPSAPAPTVVPENTNAPPPAVMRTMTPPAPSAEADTTSRIPEVEQAPALPPPITVAPAPRPRAVAPRPTAPPRQAAPRAVGRPLDLLGAQD